MVFIVKPFNKLNQWKCLKCILFHIDCNNVACCAYKNLMLPILDISYNCWGQHNIFIIIKRIVQSLRLLFAGHRDGHMQFLDNYPEITLAYFYPVLQVTDTSFSPCRSQEEDLQYSSEWNLSEPSELSSSSDHIGQ